MTWVRDNIRYFGGDPDQVTTRGIDDDGKEGIAVMMMMMVMVMMMMTMMMMMMMMMTMEKEKKRKCGDL